MPYAKTSLFQILLAIPVLWITVALFMYSERGSGPSGSGPGGGGGGGGGSGGAGKPLLFGPGFLGSPVS